MNTTEAQVMALDWAIRQVFELVKQAITRQEPGQGGDIDGELVSNHRPEGENAWDA